jgi:hypothetical protein
MPVEDATSYIKSNSLETLLSELLKECCKDLPAYHSLSPYLLSKLCDKFPQAAQSVEMAADARKWDKSGLVLFDKVQLTTYLKDVRWSSLTGALLERVLYERPKPKDVPTLLITLLAKGDVAAAGPEEMDEAVAATKMQAIQRGRKARKGKK